MEAGHGQGRPEGKLLHRRYVALSSTFLDGLTEDGDSGAKAVGGRPRGVCVGGGAMPLWSSFAICCARYAPPHYTHRDTHFHRRTPPFYTAPKNTRTHTFYTATHATPRQRAASLTPSAPPIPI